MVHIIISSPVIQCIVNEFFVTPNFYTFGLWYLGWNLYSCFDSLSFVTRWRLTRVKVGDIIIAGKPLFYLNQYFMSICDTELVQNNMWINWVSKMFTLRMVPSLIFKLFFRVSYFRCSDTFFLFVLLKLWMMRCGLMQTYVCWFLICPG